MWLKPAAFGCIVVSCAVHAAAITQVTAPDDTLSAASPPPGIVSAGNSFADMVMGSVAVPTPVPITPQETQTPTVTTLTPQMTEPLKAQITAAVEPLTLQALPDIIINDVTSTSVRPPTRPENLGKTPPPRRQTAAPAPSGNAQQNTKRGAASSTTRSSASTSQGQGQQVDQAAIAAARDAAANYPNQVVRQINRSRRERTRARGVATVSFSIGSGGQLSAVGIARSSGNAELDRLAVNHIRRAAPFPTPPHGARTSFTFEFQGS
ncbi:TonB family protein [Yoonia sp. MH D7]